jgi:ABC-type amino acid transport substrate-binding protein
MLLRIRRIRTATGGARSATPRVLFVMLAAIGLLAAGCSNNGTDDTGASPDASGAFVQQLKDKGELVAGVKFDVPQFGLKDVTSGDVEGFDADMARAVAKELGVKVKFVEALSANRIPLLQEDKVDIVFSTMTITEERKQQIDFSDVYYVAQQSFLTRKGTDMTVATAAGKTVCTSKGSTSELNLPAVQPKVKMELQDGYAQCVQLLRNNQVDAVSTDDVILLQFLKKDPDLFQISQEKFSTEPYGAGIKKGRSDFVDLVNGVIEDMKSDGRWANLYKKWVTPVTGAEAPQPPPADVKFAIKGLDAPVTPSPSPAASGMPESPSPAASAMPEATSTP